MCIRDRYMGMSFHELMIEILEQIVKKTESLKLPEKLKTHFSSKEVPAISLPSYVRQISRYAECEESIHVAALIYIDRIVAHYPSFAINSRNVHKYFLLVTEGSRSWESCSPCRSSTISSCATLTTPS
eukprot:TRINITY_DN2180_c0_g1_i7.p1 TRINITY_DN2180_c0_g1~~TRINITY_DN2180_c0_g1_i7.p1  ORF type:complete len:128 (+),score=14.02 TRINITY_DN2180_c0_g1_i7:72-455(+)